MGIIQIMTRKNLYFISPVLTSVFMLFPALGNAEFICSSDVSYKWVKTAPSKSEEPALPHKESKEEPVSSPPAAMPVPPAAPSHVRYAAVERGGVDEAAAKMALNIELSRQKARASERCKREHESFGECFATKLSVKGTVLNSLSFSARAQLEKALSEECQVQQGACLAVESSEPACREVIKAEKVASPVAETKPGEDAKKAEDADKSAEAAAPAAKGSAKADSKGKATNTKK